MNPGQFNPETWLQLRIAGATLFILFIFVIYFMSMYNKLGAKIDNLADKYDGLVKTMTETVTKVTEGQNQIINLLNQLHNDSSKKQNSLP